MKVSDFFSALIQATKTNVLAAAIPPAIAFLTSVQKDPTPINVAAQAAVLNAQMIATLPTLEKEEIALLAGTLSSELQSILTSAEAVTAAAKPA